MSTSVGRGRLRKRRSQTGVDHKPGVNPAESPLLWLRRRKTRAGEPMLTDAQFAAGERLRADFEIGQMGPRITTNWTERAGGRSRVRNAVVGFNVSDRASAAQERVRRALAAVGPELSSILVDVCCHLQRLEDAEQASAWPQRSAKVVFQLALTSLARHYGLLGPARCPDENPRRSRHWGAPGYRPIVDGAS